ncbi:60S ribosome subunit biogenesis protein NIP7 homolog isoform X1 [Pteronotus mesoamericanus]|uniref:60S ribosome subunit biogenesis protein NIP7 homolog isoform X1 n=1 Tax=Pteronotus mesoamericanus TaxID=1884717 RepID=UPI0023EAA2B5|nr:60S ribosome subunit biogenesis protein NIP7 homolog isoform X1 [Pteronotus parnellii mesoamericanus]
MRPLTEEETRVMFEKIAKYIGENLQLLVDRPDGTYCFRLHNDRVYYVSEKILKLAANISGDKLVSLGTCFGKFTKTHKFRLHVTALDYLAPYAKYKVWIKPGAEQSFLYGNHVLKSGLGRITENTSQYQGVVVYSMADIPLTRENLSEFFLFTPGMHFQVSEAFKSRLEDTRQGKKGKLLITSLVDSNFGVLPRLLTTIYIPKSSESCSIHSMQDLNLQH